MNSIIDNVRDTPKPPTPVLACLLTCGFILPTGLIVIGAVYLNDCPIQPYIPIYLIVFGVFGLSFPVDLGLCLKCTKFDLFCTCLRWYLLCFLFLFCWVIAGNVWIYSIYQPNYVKNTTDLESYCNKTLYLFAFCSTTLVNILLGLSLVVGLFYLCMMIFSKSEPDNDM